MKQLFTRIEGLEQSVMKVVERITSLKEENKILSEENNRLHREVNQLRKSSGMRSFKNDQVGGEEITLSERDIKVGHIKQELDRCIEEIENCLGQM